jgi:hypothetical protein
MRRRYHEDRMAFVRFSWCERDLTAHTPDDVRCALERTDDAFAAVRARFGPDA